MSTTINQPAGLPSAEALQQLANDIFKALPNEVPREVSLNPQEHPKANQFAERLYHEFAGTSLPAAAPGLPAAGLPAADPFNLASPQTSLPDPHFAGSNRAPLPFTGAGFNPSIPGFENIAVLPGTQGFVPNQFTPAGISTPPSFSGAGISPSTSHFQNPAGLSEPYNTHPPFGHVSEHSIPASVAGSGISPSALQHGFVYTDKASPVALPDAKYAGSGIAPQSVAGSGSSPSAITHGNNVVLSDPQTSFHDPHLAADGKVPASVAGSGRSPSLANPQASAEPLPYSGISYQKELTDILSGISIFQASPQLPSATTSIHEPAFYFLGGNKSLPGANESLAHQPLKAPGHGGALTTPPFDVNGVRKDFPVFQEKVNGHPLIWLDNAATTQKPRQVIDRVSYFYEHENSNIHRAAHELAARATDAYEGAREKVRRFINAASVNEVVFVRGTTEAINLVAKSWGEQFLHAGDEIILSNLEHHANIVPWQQLAAKKDLKIRVIPVDDDGQILLDEYAKLLNAKTRLVSFTQVSNALGTVTPAKAIIEMGHAAGAKVLLDGAQSVSHLRSDVQALNPDWFVFSGHKVFGPTGIGVLYGKEALLNETDPWQGGGNMIVDVTFEKTQYHKAPSRFEAGTGNIADAVGLGAALDYVTHIGIDLINQYEHSLLEYATGLMKQVPGLRLIGTAPDKASVLSFVLNGYTNNEVGQELNKEGIAVRTGHHCAQPILRRFGLESTVRPSLAFYNTCAEVDKLVSVLHRLKRK
jgi:cysteine desulfurase/selenocysteine lyase